MAYFAQNVTLANATNGEFVGTVIVAPATPTTIVSTDESGGAGGAIVDVEIAGASQAKWQKAGTINGTGTGALMVQTGTPIRVRIRNITSSTNMSVETGA